MERANYTLEILTFEDGSQQAHWRHAESKMIAASIIPNGDGALVDLTFYGSRCGRSNSLTFHDAIGQAGATLARWARDGVDTEDLST